MKDNHASGTIHKIFEPKTVGQNNTVIRDFVLKTDGDYPQYILIQTAGKKVELLDKVYPGERKKVYVNMEGREDRNDPNKYYNRLTAWKIESL